MTGDSDSDVCLFFKFACFQANHADVISERCCKDGRNIAPSIVFLHKSHVFPKMLESLFDPLPSPTVAKLYIFVFCLPIENVF